MIRKFIDKLLGKAPQTASKGARIPLGKRVEVAATEHGINPDLVDERAVANLDRPHDSAQLVRSAPGALGLHLTSVECWAHRTN